MVNKIKVEGYAVQPPIKVNVSLTDIVKKIHDLYFQHITPKCAEEYDHWCVDTEGNIKGITEYHHGSDSYDILEQADIKLRDRYNSLKHFSEVMNEIIQS